MMAAAFETASAAFRRRFCSLFRQPFAGSLPRRYHGGGDQYNQFRKSTQNQEVIKPNQELVLPSSVITPQGPYIPSRPIPLLPTDGMAWPQKMIAPIRQVSNPLVILDNKDWDLDELMKRFPLWKKITENPLVSVEAYVMNEPWRWCFQSIAGAIRGNNNQLISIAPAIFKKNFRVSSRTFEASLLDPIGFHFKDEKFLEILAQLDANELGVAFAALGQLAKELTNEFQEDVVVPQDAATWVRRMLQGRVTYLEQELLVDDPCLLQPYGRLGFTNRSYDLFTIILPCKYSMGSLEHSVTADVLRALSELRGYDGRFWGDVMVAEPLFRHHYGFANQRCLPPRASKLVKSQPHFGEQWVSTKTRIEMGKHVLHSLRGGLKHSIDTNVKLLHEVRQVGNYTLGDVIEHQHTSFPEFPRTVIDVMVYHRMYGHINMNHYFYNHERFVPGLQGGPQGT